MQLTPFLNIKKTTHTSIKSSRAGFDKLAPLFIDRAPDNYIVC